MMTTMMNAIKVNSFRYLRLGIFVEAALVRVVLTSIGQLTIMHIILSTSIALDDADDHKKKDEEGEREDHSNEPTSCDYTVLSLRHHDNIYK